jgi:hypothetical protein
MEAAPWVPVFVVLLLTCFVAAVVAFALVLIAWLRRRVRARHSKAAHADPDVAFVAAIKLIKHGDVVGLRQSFASGLNSNLQDKWGNDLLMAAAHTGNVAVGDLLIANGADVTRVTSSGYAAVWGALDGGHIRFLKLLFDHGADPHRIWGNRTIEEELQRREVQRYGFDAKKAEAVRVLQREYRDGRRQ